MNSEGGAPSPASGQNLVGGGLAPGVAAQLQAMGHDLQFISLRGELRMGYASAAVVEDGLVRAGADPRRSGRAGSVESGK